MITLTKHETDAVLAGLVVLSVILVPVMIWLDITTRKIEQEVEQLLQIAAERARKQEGSTNG